VIALAAPEVGRAAWLGFRNDTTSPVIVQTTGIVNRIARQGKAHILMPGDVSWDQLIVPGSQLITIADAKQPIRTLYLNAIPFTGNDLFFSIQADLVTAPAGTKPRPPGVAPTRVKLVPTKGPPPPTSDRKDQKPRK
jgi:hypothetical protein